MTVKTSGDSSRRVPGNIFGGIHNSFTTQGLRRAGLFYRALDNETGRPGRFRDHDSRDVRHARRNPIQPSRVRLF
jgi:hypothetical protein